MTNTPLAQIVRRHKALAHPVRLRILAMLRGGPLCVCQMTAVLRLAASTVSAHLSELRRADLVAERKEGKWVEYRLAEDAGSPALAAASRSSLERDPTIVQDRAILRELRRVPLDELCRAALDLHRLGIPLPAHAGAERPKARR